MEIPSFFVLNVFLKDVVETCEKEEVRDCGCEGEGDSAAIWKQFIQMFKNYVSLCREQRRNVSLKHFHLLLQATEKFRGIAMEVLIYAIKELSLEDKCVHVTSV